MAARLAPLLLAAALAFSAAAGARPCATTARLSAQRLGANAAALEPQDRPPARFSVDSATLPLRVHYDAEALAPRADRVLELLEEAWTAQVVELGMPAPLPDEGEGGDDKVDVYLTVLPAPAKALTITNGDVDDSDGRRAGYAHLRLDPTLEDELLGPFIAHEFQHLIQFGIDLDASLMLFEASAVLHEYLAFPDGGSWYENFEDFQGRPGAPIFTDGIAWAAATGQDGLYEYGASLFLMYLEEVYGDGDGALVARLWAGTVQGDDVGENEPDWLDALEDEGLDIEALVLDFATWRSVLSTLSVPGEGLSRGAEVPPTGLLNPVRLPPDRLNGAPLLIPVVRQPAQLGCLPLEVRATRTTPVPLELSARLVDEDAGDLQLTWALADTENDTVQRVVLDERGPEVELSLEVPPGQVATIAICRLAPADADDAPELREIEVRVRNTALPVPDAGPEPPADAGPDGGTDTPPPDCSCQSTGAKTGGALGGLFLLGALGFLLRARRVAARRRLKRQYERDRNRPRAGGETRSGAP